MKIGEGEEKMLEGSARALERKSVWPIYEGRQSGRSHQGRVVVVGRRIELEVLKVIVVGVVVVIVVIV